MYTDEGEEGELEQKKTYHAPHIHYGSWVIVACLSVFMAIAIRTYLLQGFLIPSESMFPTLEVGDFVLVDKLLYELQSDSGKYLPAKGQIVVFEHDESSAAGKEPELRNYIKRIVGLPGDKVEIRDFEVLINGERYLSDDYQVMLPRARDLQTPRANYGPVTLKPDQYFVLGDNRANSIDSRAFGPVEKQRIIGRAVMVYWSWDPLKKWDSIRWERVLKRLR